MKRRSPLRRGAPPKRSTKPIKRSRIKPNPKRKAERFAHSFHSHERVAFVKSLPCAACGVVGYSENAHVVGNKAMGKRGPFTWIAPLCGDRRANAGCHGLYDRHRPAFNDLYPTFTPAEAAATCHAAWLAAQSPRPR